MNPGSRLAAGRRPARATRTVWWTVAALVLAALAVVQLDLGHHLSFEAIERARGELLAWYRAHPAVTLALLFALYAAVNALPVPGVVVLTLAAGAVLGVGVGVLVVSFASALGATLAFLASRHLLRDAVRRRFPARLAATDEGVRRDGAWYVLSLHAAPFVPGFLIHLAAGLTPMPVRHYYATTQLGMLPGIVVWVNAGTQLGTIETAADVLTPGVFGSLVLLALLPLALPRLIAAARRRRRPR